MIERIGERARGGIVKGALVTLAVGALVAGPVAGEADAARKGTKQAKPTKVEICHRVVDETGAETYTFEVVSGRSLKAHQEHGDVIEGTAVDPATGAAVDVTPEYCAALLPAAPAA